MEVHCFYTIISTDNEEFSTIFLSENCIKLCELPFFSAEMKNAPWFPINCNLNCVYNIDVWTRAHRDFIQILSFYNLPINKTRPVVSLIQNAKYSK